MLQNSPQSVPGHYQTTTRPLPVYHPLAARLSPVYHQTITRPLPDQHFVCERSVAGRLFAVRTSACLYVLLFCKDKPPLAAGHRLFTSIHCLLTSMHHSLTSMHCLFTSTHCLFTSTHRSLTAIYRHVLIYVTIVLPPAALLQRYDDLIAICPTIYTYTLFLCIKTILYKRRPIFSSVTKVPNISLSIINLGLCSSP